MNSHAKSSIAEQMSNVDLTTITELEKAQIQQLGLLDGIQFAFQIASITTVAALILSLFIKRVDVSKEAVAKLEAEDATSSK